MKADIPIIKQGDRSFVPIPSSARLAIILPTVRWTPLAKAIIGSLVGVANEEIAVLIADNSENPEKRELLRRVCEANPNVIAISHEKNIGGENFYYLFDWSKDIEFMAMMADDDWLSPTYHPDAYRTLLANPNASCVEVGTTYVYTGDGNFADVSQPSMPGLTPIERMRQWNGIVARATMYNVSKRAALDASIRYLRATPLYGLTLMEDLWELNRLALGDFLSLPGEGCLMHYPNHGSHQGDGTQRFHELFCKPKGLQYPFVYFLGLSTAVQCAIFLMGRNSPVADPLQRALCGQHVFAHTFATSFLPKFSGESSHQAVAMLFANHPEAMDGFLKYANPPFAQQPVFEPGIIDWFIEVIKVFETKETGDEPLLSDKFRQFVATHF